MIRRGKLTVLILLCAAPLAVSGEKLPFSGTFGNEAGCKLAGTGNYSEDDGARVLTSESFETMVSSCSFDKIETVAKDHFRVSMTCGWEGEGPESNTEDKIEVRGDPETGFLVEFADGNSWGPLKKCP